MRQPLKTELERAELEQLLKDLKCSFSQTQRALLTSNLAELELQTFRQRTLCQQITDSWRKVASQAVPESALQTAKTCRRAAGLQGALLKKLQRGLGLLTLFQTFPAITYERPRPAQSTCESGGR
jgi:hypothetical protein